MNLSWVVAMIALSSSAAACSIERTKPVNADCLQDRECVLGLECQSRSDGRYACTMPGGQLPPEDAAVQQRDVVTDETPADATADIPAALDVAPTDVGHPADAPASDGAGSDASPD